MRIFRFLAGVLFFAAATPCVWTAAPSRPPLAPGDIAAIATLLKLEDTRQFDEAALVPLLQRSHPEVRRRTVLAIGRIADARGKPLLVSARSEKNVDVLATVAFSTGQLKDAEAVDWLGTTLSSPATPPAVAFEAARALGKIQSPAARTALDHYLATVKSPATRASAPVIGEALLSTGRFATNNDRQATPDDVAAITRWMRSPDVEIRWRTSWALFRLRDPLTVPSLVTLAQDRSADVRYWAVRGLAPAVVDKSTVKRAETSAVLLKAVSDEDRRVRTEAIRALGLYDDDKSFAAVVAAVDAKDSWLSVSAVEALGNFKTRADAAVPLLTRAIAPDHPTSIRITALTPLRSLAPEAAVEAAALLMRSDSTSARTSAAGALRQLGAAGQARLDALAADPATRDLIPAGRGGRGSRPDRPTRTDADYRSMVERLIVPDYNGAPRPRATWDTPRGQIEIELYPGDAPFGVEHFVHVVESGAIVGTEFSRVVPNFVAQQATIGNFAPLRDEVSRLGLTRGNLSWASGGLDTGVPGYTLATAPHPHIEGDFTALGHVVRGLDVIDRLELGDRIIAAKMKK